MSERLVFNYGVSPGKAASATPGRRREVRGSTQPSGGSAGKPAAHTRERSDPAYLGLVAFTTVLFFRPQDLIPVLNPLHLAEVTAIFSLVALAHGRLTRGLPLTRVVPELIGVVGLGAVMLLTAPFSVWPGGAVATFTNLFVKVLLVFVLMVNTLDTPRRVEQFTWIIVTALGYIAFRAVFDYARGVNLIENGRVRGAVGGIFKNPNDLALNLVAVLPLGIAMALRPGNPRGRAFAALCALFMIGGIVATRSRGGTLGLLVIVSIIAAKLVRRRPGLVFGALFVLLMSTPLLPESYVQRVTSIVNPTLDDTGSREARRTVMREAWQTFLAHPFTGVGAGQFKNDNPDGRAEAWRETHNVVLQVASELGVLGLGCFGFLIARALLAHQLAMGAAVTGWFVCALFASVAYHWTFYYLLGMAIASREILKARLTSRVRPPGQYTAATLAGARG
jgi:O-antigen ligase